MEFTAIFVGSSKSEWGLMEMKSILQKLQKSWQIFL
ncbi:unnamed protein product [Mycetohabitans rhizoxinica HKI 454]|uniref:Uncharacterized protein n=1 Tax=Mycetohabitans rhizoxinica (strain DSM 19002 / CIP 109453 / HKI 454) TaxID=882378 RepID=E5AMW1_MYCRK|nr:unnamed protein product [Mycetohabitans rhizoxinica HKI 454]